MQNKTRRAKQQKNKTQKKRGTKKGGFFNIFKKRDPSYDAAKKEMNSIVNIYYHAKKMNSHSCAGILIFIPIKKIA